MCQLIAAAALLLSGGIADAGGIAVLVKQLGSPDFRARESASKQLGVIGAPALPALRAAETNADPEVSRRAAALAEAITKRVDNDRTLTPKLVELSAEGVPLSEVLARLEKQTGYKLVVADPTLLRKNVSVITKGQVPFWTAVGQVCDAAKLSVDTSSDAERQLRAARQLAGSRPTRTGANGIRGGIIRSDTIHLQPRSEPLNPSCVSGAVRVEAVPFPTVGRVVVPFDTIPVLLQVTPESRLRWIRVESVRITKAVDDAGQNLIAQTVADAAALPTQVTRVRGGAIAVNARGGVNLVPGQPMTTNRITLNRPTQAIARLKVGENPSKQLRKLTGVIRGEVRSAPEEIATLAGLGDKPTATNSHGVGLRVSGVTKSGDDYTMDVTMNYARPQCNPRTAVARG